MFVKDDDKYITPNLNVGRCVDFLIGRGGSFGFDSDFNYRVGYFGYQLFDLLISKFEKKNYKIKIGIGTQNQPSS